MRQPSRRMPKAQPKRIAPLGWLFLLGLVLCCLYLIGLYPLTAACILAAIFLAGVLESWRSRRYFQEMAAVRSGESICTFARSFDCRTVDTWVIRAVYEEIRGYVGQVPLRAGDDLERGLRIDSEDLDFDLASLIAERTGRSLDHSEHNPYFGRIRTVGDLVHFFNAQPRIA